MGRGLEKLRLINNIPELNRAASELDPQSRVRLLEHNLQVILPIFNDREQFRKYIYRWSKEVLVSIVGILKKNRISIDTILANKSDLAMLLSAVSTKSWADLSSLISRKKLNALIGSTNQDFVTFVMSLFSSSPSEVIKIDKFRKFVDVFQPDIPLSFDDNMIKLMEYLPSKRILFIDFLSNHYEDASEFINLHLVTFVNYLPPYLRENFFKKCSGFLMTCSKEQFLQVTALLPASALTGSFLQNHVDKLTSRPDLVKEFIIDSIKTNRFQQAMSYLNEFKHLVPFTVDDSVMLLKLVINHPAAKEILPNPSVQQAIEELHESLITQLEPHHVSLTYWQTQSDQLHALLRMSVRYFDYGISVFSDDQGHYEGRFDGEIYRLGIRDTFEPFVILILALMAALFLMIMGLIPAFLGLLTDKLKCEPVEEQIRLVGESFEVNAADVLRTYDPTNRNRLFSSINEITRDPALAASISSSSFTG
jgi:hypothetical protein